MSTECIIYSYAYTYIYNYKKTICRIINEYIIYTSCDCTWETDHNVTKITEIHFCLCMKVTHACITQRHQAFDTRWPGLLLQMTFSDAVKS